jgi:hypothetical protein
MGNTIHACYFCLPIGIRMLCMTVSHRRELAQARLQGTQRNYPIECYCLVLFTKISLTMGIYLAIIHDTNPN